MKNSPWFCPLHEERGDCDCLDEPDDHVESDEGLDDDVDPDNWFRCARCGEWCPPSMGAADDQPDVCDKCWTAPADDPLDPVFRQAGERARFVGRESGR